MKSAVINKTSPFVDVVELLSGAWQEYDAGEFHVVKTPFFLSLTATLDSGSHALPFRFAIPVAAVVSHADGSVDASVIRPGETAVNLATPGLFSLTVFGVHAEVKGNST